MSRILIPLLFGLTLSGITLGSGFFLRSIASAAPETVAMLAAFFGAVWVMGGLPLLWLATREKIAPWRDGAAMILAVLIGVGTAAFFAPTMITAALGAGLIALAFAGMIIATGELTVVFAPRAAPSVMILLTAIFIFSPWWSGFILDGGEDFLKLFAVWLAPLAMVTAALPLVNFSCLPALYHIWMGSVCPVPHSVALAMISYLAPTALLWLLAFATRILRQEPTAENRAGVSS